MATKNIKDKNELDFIYTDTNLKEIVTEKCLLVADEASLFMLGQANIIKLINLTSFIVHLF